MHYLRKYGESDQHILHSTQNPLHRLADILDETCVSALRDYWQFYITVCDTTSKTGTKMAAMSGLEEYGGNLISIGKQPVNESMMFASEKFVLNFVALDFITVIKSNGTSFNQLRLKHYRSKHSKS